MSTKRQRQKNDWKGKVHEVLRQSKLSSTLGEIKHERVHMLFFQGCFASVPDKRQPFLIRLGRFICASIVRHNYAAATLTTRVRLT